MTLDSYDSRSLKGIEQSLDYIADSLDEIARCLQKLTKSYSSENIHNPFSEESSEVEA